MDVVEKTTKTVMGRCRQLPECRCADAGKRRRQK